MQKLKIQVLPMTTFTSIAIALTFIVLMVIEYGFVLSLCSLLITKLIFTYKAMNYSFLVLFAGFGCMAFITALIGYMNVLLVRTLKLKLKQNIPIIICSMLASVFFFSMVVEITCVGATGALWASQFSVRPIIPTVSLSIGTIFLALITVPIGYANVLLAHKSCQSIFQKSAWLMAAITTFCWAGLVLVAGYSNPSGYSSPLGIMIIISIIGAWVAAFYLSRSGKLLNAQS